MVVLSSCCGCLLSPCGCSRYLPVVVVLSVVLRLFCVLVMAILSPWCCFLCPCVVIVGFLHTQSFLVRFHYFSLCIVTVLLLSFVIFGVCHSLFVLFCLLSSQSVLFVLLFSFVLLLLLFCLCFCRFHCLFSVPVLCSSCCCVVLFWPPKQRQSWRDSGKQKRQSSLTFPQLCGQLALIPQESES